MKNPKLKRPARCPRTLCSGFFLRFDPDPIGELLGTGYSRFQHASGMAGLAKVTGDRLDILAVNATQEGQGQFREFIAAAKKTFRVVAVWEDWNPILAPALERYGFKPAQCVEAWGETNNGWEWNLGQNAATHAPGADEKPLK